MPGNMFSISFGWRAGVYKWAPVWGGGKYWLHRLRVPVWGEGNARQKACSVPVSGGRQACINGHHFGVEESTTYIGFVYPFGVKGLRQKACSVSVSDGGQACINGHQFGVEERTDYIGFVSVWGGRKY